MSKRRTRDDKRSTGEFRALYERAAAKDRLKPCHYGHYDCSPWDGGPCSNEVLGKED